MIPVTIFFFIKPFTTKLDFYKVYNSTMKHTHETVLSFLTALKISITFAQTYLLISKSSFWTPDEFSDFEI